MRDISCSRPTQYCYVDVKLATSAGSLPQQQHRPFHHHLPFHTTFANNTTYHQCHKYNLTITSTILLSLSSPSQYQQQKLEQLKQQQYKTAATKITAMTAAASVSSVAIIIISNIHASVRAIQLQQLLN